MVEVRAEPVHELFRKRPSRSVREGLDEERELPRQRVPEGN